MAKRRILVTTFAAAALLGACGAKEDLKPAANQPAPAIPVGATRAPTTEELTTPDAQAKPARSDERLRLYNEDRG